MKKEIKKCYKEIKAGLKNLNKTICYIHRVSGKLRICIFFDILWCFIRYNTDENEYRIFEFYKIKSDKRKTYLSHEKHENYKLRIIPLDIINVIDDNDLFNRRFKDYTKRDVYNINDLTFKQYEDLILKHKKLLCRSNTSDFINTYKIYDVKDFRSPAYMADKIKKDKLYIIEKCFSQNKKLSTINEDLVIINVVSIYNNYNCNILCSTLKFKENNKTYTGYIDVKNKCIKGHFRDEDDNLYEESFDGFEIPYYSKILDLTKKLSKELEEIMEVEWSFAVNSRGSVYLMNARLWNDTIFVQIPEYLNNRIGLLDKYKRCIK